MLSFGAHISDILDWKPLAIDEDQDSWALLDYGLPHGLVEGHLVERPATGDELEPPIKEQFFGS